MALVRHSDREWFLVFSAEREDWPTTEWTDAYQLYMEEALSGRICLYVGDVCRQRELGESRRCLEQMGREAVLGGTGILFEKEWLRKDVEYVEPPWREWEQEMLDTERIEETGQKILDFLHVLWENNQVTVSVLERFRKELMQTIYWYFNRQNLLITRIFDGREFDDAYEKSVYSLSNMEAFIHQIYEKLAGFCHQDNKQENVVNHMRQYIQEHLKEDLSRKTLAGAVFLSEDYISKIFMNVTGMSIPSYVTSCRVKKAQEYLRYSNLSVSQIALEVGYTNFSYFSKTFRDYTGCTPNEYRSRVQSKK